MERRRGRPAHPDILTPREWEVLDLLRQSLSNEEIGERLNISVPGVKYHVSKILSKLHVSSREEAAARRPEERRRSWLSLSLAAKAIGAVAVIAAVAAIAALVYGVTRTAEGGDPAATITAFDLDSLTPGEDPARDLALLDAGVPGDIASVEIRPADGADVETEFDFTPASPLGDVGAWLVTVTTWSETYPGFVSGPMGRPDPPPGCYVSTAWRLGAQETQANNVPTSATKAELVDDSECHVDSISRDTAIAIAGFSQPRGPHGKTSPPLVGSSMLGAAVDALVAANFDAQPSDAPADRAVWLVLYTGPVVDLAVPSPAPISGQPTPAPSCSRAATIVDATNGDVLLSDAIPIGAC